MNEKITYCDICDEEISIVYDITISDLNLKIAGSSIVYSKQLCLKCPKNIVKGLEQEHADMTKAVKLTLVCSVCGDDFDWDKHVYDYINSDEVMKR